MKKIYSQNETIIQNGFLIGFFSFFMTFITAFIMQLSEMSLVKIAFLPFVFGFYYFFIFVIYSVIRLNKYNNKIFQATGVKERKIKQILIIFIVSFLTYYLLDTIVFLFDNNLSKEFADGLLKITENPTSNEVEEINTLSKLPFSFQNFILNFISAFFSILFTYIFIKK
jgi:hypothetical protein